MTRKLLFLAHVVGTLICAASTASAATVKAASGNQADVQVAIRTARDGDTVLIPAGTFVWHKAVKLGTVTWEKGGPRISGEKHLTIQGAGIDQTIIVDEVPPNPVGSQDDSAFVLYTREGKPFRITGMTIKNGITDVSILAGLRVLGTSKQVRIDHIKFDRLKTRGLYVNGEIYGVIDHCEFIIDSWQQAIWIGHSAWGRHEHGDGSWASPLSLGTEKAVYIENDVFRAEGPSTAVSTVDSWMGGRWVFRHNRVENMTIGNHGTESSGRLRGCFSMEIYDNVFHRPDPKPWAGLGQSRSGTCVMFNNTVTGSYNSFLSLHNYRENHSFRPWGACDGTSPFDVNDGVVYDSGKHSGQDKAPILTAANKSWKPNQWVGYVIHNLRREDSSRIKANTADTITVEGDTYRRKEGSFAWNIGDEFKIMKAKICLDGIGRSTGNLLSGSDPQPRQWPEQALEPVYAWNNTLNGKPAKLRSASILVQEGRDFFIDKPRPGYKPYTYPHPLVEFFDKAQLKND